MQVLAQRGGFTFLMLTEGRRDRLNSATGRVFDQRAGVLHDELPVLSIIARGYWDEPAGDLDLAAIVSEAKAALEPVAAGT